MRVTSPGHTHRAHLAGAQRHGGPISVHLLTYWLSVTHRSISPNDLLASVVDDISNEADVECNQRGRPRKYANEAALPVQVGKLLLIGFSGMGRLCIGDSAWLT